METYVTGSKKKKTLRSIPPQKRKGNEKPAVAKYLSLFYSLKNSKQKSMFGDGLSARRSQAAVSTWTRGPLAWSPLHFLPQIEREKEARQGVLKKCFQIIFFAPHFSFSSILLFLHFDFVFSFVIFFLLAIFFSLTIAETNDFV